MTGSCDPGKSNVIPWCDPKRENPVVVGRLAEPQNSGKIRQKCKQARDHFAHLSRRNAIGNDRVPEEYS